LQRVEIIMEKALPTDLAKRSVWLNPEDW